MFEALFMNLPITFLIVLLGALPAHACPSYGDMRTILFERAPSKIEAPFAAEVTVTRSTRFDAVLRVNKVLKGTAPQHLQVSIEGPTDCDIRLMVGDTGSVLGEVRDARLIAVSRSPNGSQYDNSNEAAFSFLGMSPSAEGAVALAAAMAVLLIIVAVAWRRMRI
jgi:hypothetical protein